MMLALAKFIMRGRLQAAVLALLGIPFITHGAIGLVALRKGANEGLFLIAIALIPAILLSFMGQPIAVHLVGTLLGLLAVYIPAMCLRATVNWSFSLQALIVFSVFAVLLAAQVVPELLGAFTEITAIVIAMMEGQSLDAELPQPGFVALSGFLGLGLVFNGITGLTLARWWQALLYNPDGFALEFQQIRLGAVTASLIMALMLLCFAQGPEYVFWASMFACPLVLITIAIVHNAVKVKALSKTWLFVFYALMIAFSPVLLVLAVIGFLDSWLNIRDRLSKPVQ